jgi:two-component system sensor histidine kinase UhpB
MVGRRPQELLGRDDFEVGWPAEAARVTRENDLAVLRSGTLREVIESAPHPDGTLHHWLNFKFPLADETGKFGVAGMSIDITERTNAEERVRQYSEEVRALCASLVNAQEAERRRVAGELHDLIGQNLTVLALDLAALKSALPGEVRKAHSERLRAMEGVLNNTVEAIRGVMAQLRPPALEEYGLVPALHWYGSDYSARTGVKVYVAAGDESRRLARNLEVDLFRVVQEALTNVAKHSRARSAEVAIRVDDAMVKVSVSDDGVGFADAGGARSARRGGWGLPTMRERAQAHGGSLRVEFPERGTRLVVEVPARYDD